MKTVLVALGTRPEAIKLASVILELKKYPEDFRTIVCATGQHRQMLDQVLAFFGIEPDHDVDVMVEDQSLFELTAGMLTGLRNILEREAPDIVLVQGDTTTTFVASLAAFYLKIPIGHVEAGLRTHDKHHPFPEEKNRHLVSVLADFHFAPTQWAAQNLIAEGIPQDSIWTTGNTGIDSLFKALDLIRSPSANYGRWNIDNEDIALPEPAAGTKKSERRLILVTGHRRESFGDGFQRICRALRKIAQANPDVDIVYPVHLNPNVRRPVYDILGQREDTDPSNVHLIEPLDYPRFVRLMADAHLVLTDSGGIQEEAPSLGKPVLVLRDTTERPEGINAGSVKLVGTDTDTIVRETQALLENGEQYTRMASRQNPYGDGTAATQIVALLKHNPKFQI
ncbi:MAG: UDP-N-acetylglucosamine 2-epimerase (non-hydrolyzing) [Bauldia litoralis]